MRTVALSFAVLGSVAAFAACQTAHAPDPEEVASIEQSLHLVPQPPWPEGDELGNGNTQGYGTRLRCLPHLAHPGSREYELSHVRSETMPVSPFGVPLEYEFRDTAALPFTKHAFNGETICGEPGAQGTQMDALGHFAYFEEIWDAGDPTAPGFPQNPPPLASARYYGGFTQADVKPTPDSPLLRLGIEKVKPIFTSAVLLDARTFLGGGDRLEAGQLITADDIENMLQAQGLGWRGLLPGDVLYIYTGWEDLWGDPDLLGEYYTRGPGLAYDAALYIGERGVVLVALDNPFTDPVADLASEVPPEGTPPGLPFAIHHHNLTQSGVHQIQNAHLEELAGDNVWTSCTIILPLRERGASGSPVRPIAYGVPRPHPGGGHGHPGHGHGPGPGKGKGKGKGPGRP